ncbi:MAG: hypothetical protein JNL90_17570 [Planctomycetes bacterium]|nr:hypothetical protein [Planctomycetota bacterium]
MSARIVPLRGARRRRQGGFSLLEVMLVSSMMMTVLTTIGVGLRAGHASKREMERRAQLTVVAGELLDRLFRISYGSAGDASASNSQLTELFDADADLGTATVSSLRTAAGSTGYQFEIDDFPWGGQFEVRIDADLNGDGDESDEREGRADLLRLNVLWDGILILESVRCAPWSST